MANEKVNKVILGSETLIDLTGDTVNENNLLAGATAHDASGEQIQGNVTVPDVLDDLSDVNASSPASGDVLFNDGTEWINKKITVEVTQAEYNAMEIAGTVDPDVRYRIKDGILTCAPVDDNDVSEQKTWSSDKISKSLPQIFSQDYSNVDINTAWGSMYVMSGNGIDVDISSLGLTSPPKKVFVSASITNGSGALMVVQATSTTVSVNIMRPTSITNASGTMNVLIFDD